MRSALTLVWLSAVVGCSGASPATQDMAMSLDLFMAPADLSGTAPCSVAKQTGCAAAQKCVPKLGTSSITGTCVADGTVTEGQPCQPINDPMLINDNCKAGLLCDAIADLSMTGTVCRKICSADSECTTAGQKCASVVDPSVSYGACLPSCAPFTTGACAAGSDCSVSYFDVAATQTSSLGFFICKQTGTGALYTPCMDNFDCAADLACDFVNGWCAPNCDNTHTCAQPPMTDGGPSSVSCQTFTNLPNGEGFCG